MLRFASSSLAFSTVLFATALTSACSHESSSGPAPTHQGVSATPLSFGQSPGAGDTSSEVDEASDAWVLQDRSLVEFDQDGKTLSTTTLETASDVHFVSVRVRDGVAAVGGRVGISVPMHPPPVALVELLDTTTGAVSKWNGPFTRDGAVVDACPDGGAVAFVRGSSAITLTKLDAAAAQEWQTSLKSIPSKLRCLGDGTIIVLMHVTGFDIGDDWASVAQYEADGTLDWTWTGPENEMHPLTFDVDETGQVILASQRITAFGTATHVDALDRSGQRRWSWESTGNDSPWAIWVDDAGGAVVTGGVNGTATDASRLLTVSFDPSGAVRWMHGDTLDTTTNLWGQGVAIDGAGNALVCAWSSAGIGYAALYAPDGTRLWTAGEPAFSPVSADVTNGIGRCIGDTGTNLAPTGVGVLAFQVQ